MKKRSFSMSVIMLGATLVLSGAGWTSSSIDESDWVFAGAPPGDTSLRVMAVDPADDDLWYLGSHENGVYVTRDGGGSWEQHITGNVGAVAIDPGSHDIVYASSGSDLYRSEDRGVTWDLLHSFPNPIPGPTLDAPTFIDSILVSVVDGTILVGLTSQFHSARVYTSEDEGSTWQISYESAGGFHFWDLAEVPMNGYWFFCTEDPSHIQNPVVMRSTDRGQSWEEMLPLTGIPTAGHGLNLEVHPVTQAVYFLTESSFVASSADFGESWAPYHHVDFGSVLLIDRNVPNRFFGGELIRGLKVGGVYFSEDTGASFSFIGLSDRTIAALALDGASTKLFALAYGEGVYVLRVGDEPPEATVDIKPGDAPNSINPDSRGVIPVALLGGEEFDVYDVNATTLRFGPNGAELRHDGHLEDVNGDGFTDLVGHFGTRESGIACGDTDATLRGELLDATPFEGTDSVETVGCP